MHCGADLVDRHPSDSDDATAKPRTDTVSPDASESPLDFDVVESSHSDETATQSDLPAEYRSRSDPVDQPNLLPDGFARKAAAFVLSLAAGLAVGIGSMYVLSEILSPSMAFLLGVVCWLGSTAAFLRLSPG